MRGYLAILRAHFLALLQYRAAAVAGMGTQLFWGFIRVMIFAAFYRSGAGPEPMSLAEVISYVWLGQAFLGLQPWGVDRDVRDQIRSGAVAYELLRPLDLYALWFSRAVALRCAPTLLRSVPILALAGLFFGLNAPASAASLGAFLVALLGAVLLSSAFTVLLNTTLMWTVAGEGVSHLVFGLIMMLSGMVVPLPLFPDWSQPVLTALPFRGLADVPFRLYTGHLPPADLLPALLHQLAWTAALVLLGRSLLAAGKRRLVVQGG
ncbi:MAG: ABC-2 family transporter protein [Gemmatimonadota bacterium]